MADLRIVVVEARNLNAADANGKSDPYCVLHGIGKTPVVWANLNPRWDHAFSLHLNSVPRHVVLEVFDKDRGRSDDVLGQGRLPLSVCNGLQVGDSADLWVRLTSGKPPFTPCGAVHVLVQLSAINVAPDTPLVPPLTALTDRFPLPEADVFKSQLYALVDVDEGEGEGEEKKVGEGKGEGEAKEGKDVASAVVPLNEGVLYEAAAVLRPENTRGSLVLTTHRVVFVPTREGGDEDEGRKTRWAFTQFPLASVRDASCPRPAEGAGDAASHDWVVRCGFEATYQFSFVGQEAEADRQAVAEEVGWRRAEAAFPFSGSAINPVSVATGEPAPAFVSPVPDSDAPLQWDPHQELLRTEFARQGVQQDATWRFTELNAAFEACPSYPSVLVVPAAVDDGKLAGVAKARSKGRLPALTWKPTPHKSCSGSLCRSAQPLEGLALGLNSSGNKLREDDLLLLSIRHTATVGEGDQRTTPTLLIFDARPKLNAQANAVMGKGFEQEDYLNSLQLPELAHSSESNVLLQFCDIGNIHVMRESLRKLVQAVDGQAADYLQALHKSGWLGHVSTVLKSAVDIAKALVANAPCLVHCSDGWDRTAQLSATAQLLVDPYYRTLDGFACLVEKDWVAFGHKFDDRCGGADGEHEESPVFLQWLDVVWQVWCQNPTSFEFNEHMLLLLARECYGRWTRTFLFNQDQHRAQCAFLDSAFTVWDMVAGERALFTNPLYDADAAVEELQGPTVRALVVRPQVASLQLWTSVYCRFRYDSQAVVLTWPAGAGLAVPLQLTPQAAAIARMQAANAPRGVGQLVRRAEDDDHDAAHHHMVHLSAPTSLMPKVVGVRPKSHAAFAAVPVVVRRHSELARSSTRMEVTVVAAHVCKVNHATGSAVVVSTVVVGSDSALPNTKDYFIAYELQASSGERHWSVLRRYSNLRTFRLTLKKQMPSLAEKAPFPGRTFGACDVQRRRSQLDLYFRALFSANTLHAATAVNNFLSNSDAAKPKDPQ